MFRMKVKNRLCATKHRRGFFIIGGGFDPIQKCKTKRTSFRMSFWSCWADSNRRTPAAARLHPHRLNVPSARRSAGPNCTSREKKNPSKPFGFKGLELLGGFEPPTSSLPSAVGYAPSGERLLSIEILAFCNVLNLETTSGCMICTASLRRSLQSLYQAERKPPLLCFLLTAKPAALRNGGGGESSYKSRNTNTKSQQFQGVAPDAANKRT